MKKLILLALIFSQQQLFSQCETTEQCLYQFELIDSFGDSWNGNTMTVSQNGVENILTLTQEDNGYYKLVELPLCDGQPFTITWNPGGNFPGEVMIIVTNPLGQIIYRKPSYNQNLPDSVLFSGMANCSEAICTIPSNIKMTERTAESATFTWEELGTAAQWSVLMLPETEPAPEASAVGTIVSELTYTATGLSSDINYMVYVKSICSEGFESDWTGFSARCLRPFVASSSGQVYEFQANWYSFSPAEFEYILKTADNPAPDDDSIGISTEENNYYSYGLPVGDYEFYVRSDCGSGLKSVWSTVSTFSVLCAQPIDVQVNGDQVTWDPNGGSSQWEVLIGIGTGVPYTNQPGILTTDNPFIATELLEGTEYSVFVRSVCDSNITSAWSQQRIFTYEGALSTIENANADFAVIPNPATTSIQIITTHSDIQTIKVYDLLGKVMKDESATPTIDISNLSAGVYIIEVQNTSGAKAVRKLSKQ